jgi:phage FluMu gp28-like protein
MNTYEQEFFLPYQQAWIDDQSNLKIMEKSRQIGITYADAFDSVIKASHRSKSADVWVSSRDEPTARLYLQHCKRWAQALNIGAQYLGQQIVSNEKKDLTAEVLRFKTGFCIYCLTSSPDAIASRTGHVKLDEFALHKDQRELFRVAKGCTLWGFQLSIISTHRGSTSVFNETLRSIKEQGNPMRFSHHRVILHDAVDQGLVERINYYSGRKESRTDFIKRIHDECLDEEQWQQEYCCQPADESSAFITWEMITSAEFPGCMKSFEYLVGRDSVEPSGLGVPPLGGPAEFGNGQSEIGNLYVGVDVARKKHLCVIDVGEKIGDVMWDRYRIELQDRSFSEIQHELYRVLSLPKVQRCCIDATGLGMQLAEEAKQQFGWKVEPVTFTAPVKEELAFHLRHCFEDRLLRIDPSPALRSDLRGIKKETTIAGNIRFVAESDDDGHCDRFWAKALRQHAAKQRREFFAIVIE